MTDRSLRYVVEIDASSAADAIQRIKASLSSEITGAGSTGNGSAAAGMKQAAVASAGSTKSKSRRGRGKRAIDYRRRFGGC